MHCYVFGMYLKDGPLRSSDYIFTKCMLQYFAGNIECQGGEGWGGEWGVGEEEEEEEEGGNFKL